MKKQLVIGIIILFVGTSAATNVSFNQILDQIDQQNSNIGNSYSGFYICNKYYTAQEFKPSLNALTRVAIYCYKEGDPPNNLIVSIRDSLTGIDLTSKEIPKDDIPKGSSKPDWIIADFNDIGVIPGLSYYIVCRTIGGSLHDNAYCWRFIDHNPYPNGSAYCSSDNGIVWQNDSSNPDFCFKTYGYNNNNNNPPNQPSKPVGKENGEVNSEYTYTSTTFDPEGDQVYYLWDWGDGSISIWDGPYSSGATCDATHTWSDKGNYSIKVKTKDTFGAESPWSDPLPITMPYSYKPTLQFLEWLFQRFPHAFPILRQVLGF
jgi:hypothetical protein